ncbi:hypothetical protein GlitD10_1321 [Gloeomargarita lithophora Alchichica-D10]|uniref:Uncharacterized protein n=1 Tax=Gloeomargarita lithophora Alchichica-D10 TaxID=1188229 RepID=A0A1J0ACI7_9CYAN|nr:hypothetical protein [Gloeomargarita lithophora]APB33642.1 hypothetical protein GlitD10_1321 [Gloeomargarita lithophora Alchichica-D10]
MSVQQEHTFTPIPGFNLADITLEPVPESPSDLHTELATLRAQAECLLQELQMCQHTANEQQRLIETLATQLQQSQQQAHHLEQNQSFQQKRLQEQEAALIQEQQHRQELEGRFYRQQQENLQLRQLLRTHAPNTDWEPQARLYQDPIPPWQVVSADTVEPELTNSEPTALMEPPPATPVTPASGKKNAVHLPLLPSLRG